MLSPDPPVMMPVRRTDDEDKGAGAPPGVVQWQDPDERDEALSMAAATNVALIRAAATRKIAESRSKGTPSRKNETVDSSAHNLLRQPASQESLAQYPGVPAPPPLNRPLPPLAPRTAPDAQDRTVPNCTLSRPRSLKRDQPHQGHPVTSNVPLKMPNVAPTPTQFFNRHIENVIQEQGPSRSFQLPADVNTDNTTFEYLGLKLGKSFAPPKQYRTRRERVKINNTDQTPVVQLPVGQALGTLPFRSNANGGISPNAPEQYRAPEPRQSASEVQGSKNEAERKQEKHLAMAKRIEQEILDEEEAEREAKEMNAAPMSYRPSAMPGMERVSTQSEKRQPPVRRTSPGRITDRIETFDTDADYMEPIDVIWKKKTVTLLNLVRCIKCHGLMSLYMDLTLTLVIKKIKASCCRVPDGKCVKQTSHSAPNSKWKWKSSSGTEPDPATWRGELYPAIRELEQQLIQEHTLRLAALIPPVADLVLPNAQDDPAGPLGFGFAPQHIALVPERQQEEAGIQNQRRRNVAQGMLPPNLIAPATNGIQVGPMLSPVELAKTLFALREKTAGCWRIRSD
ncbi:unnamed protein product [Caenorhabditis brenneri]